MQIIKSDGKTAITYPYTPSDTAAYIFIAIFGVGTIAHIFWIFRFRAAYFVPFVIGAICETFGYYGRSWSHRDQPNLRPYVLQYLLILPAPVFLAATLYMSLGRITTALEATNYTMIRPSRLTKLFVILDVLCFAIQMAGAGLESTTDPNIGETGGKLVTAGVVLQIICTAWFVLIVFKFHRRLARKPTMVSENGSVRWRLYLLALYMSSAMIMVRNLVRAIQEIQGFYGFVNSHEVFVYLFDAVPMAFVVCVFLVLHPSRLILAARRSTKLELPRSTQVVEAKDEDQSIPLPKPWEKVAISTVKRVLQMN